MPELPDLGSRKKSTFFLKLVFKQATKHAFLALVYEATLERRRMKTNICAARRDPKMSSRVASARAVTAALEFGANMNLSTHHEDVPPSTMPLNLAV